MSESANTEPDPTSPEEAVVDPAGDGRARHKGIAAAAVIIVAAGAVAGGYVVGRHVPGGPAHTSPGAAPPVPPETSACLRNISSITLNLDDPYDAPVAPARTHEITPLSGVRLVQGSDEVAARAMILDFVPTPETPGVDPTNTITLIEISANITTATPWTPGDSLMMTAYEPSPGQPDTLAPRCPLVADPGLLAAMRDSGHPPLPAQINPGQTITGWVAFAVPPARGLNLKMQRRDADSSFSIEAHLLNMGDKR